MSEKLTPAKFAEITERLKHFETVRRSEVAAAIKHAKEFGDLSENAEYSAAKDEQVKIEIEINRLSEILANAEIIDESTISTKEVSLGTIVRLFDVEFSEELEYRIVSTIEADSGAGKISDVSPLGRAILGKRKGETVTVDTPGGKLQFKIINIAK